MHNITRIWSGRFSNKSKYEVPSTLSSFIYFLINILFYAILTWYFDHIISNNRGKQYEYFFFLKRSYWIRNSSISAPPKLGNSNNIDESDTNSVKSYASSLINGKLFLIKQLDRK
jgi:hypothetical protein